MADFDLTTDELIKATVRFLTGLGHTNVRTCERWERDGVHHVWSDQSTEATERLEARPGLTVTVRYGWALDVSGTDNPCFPAGVAFSYVPKEPSQERHEEARSWDDLRRLVSGG